MDRLSKRARTIGSEPESDRWSSIHIDILTQISDKIVTYADHFRFVTTCRSWYSLATDFDKSRSGPLYMSGTDGPRRATVQDPASGASLALELPESTGSQCWGSPFGWIITFEPSNLRFSLVNPFKGSTIPIPNLPKANARAMKGPGVGAFLTANPETDPENSILIVVSRSKKLAFVRPARRSKVWSRIDCDSHLTDISQFARSGGKLYGLQTLPSAVQLFLFELDGPIAPQATRILTLTLTLNLGPYRDHGHIVDLDGELCLCVRYYPNPYSPSPIVDFKIFKIDLSNGGLTRILTLGDRCLFLGNTGSFACEARYPTGGLFELEGPRNCEYVSSYIFYTCDHPRRSFNDTQSFTIEVWDVVNSNKVYIRKDTSPTSSLYGPLWILP